MHRCKKVAAWGPQLLWLACRALHGVAAWITSTRFPSGADGQKVGAAALYVAVAKAAGPDKWREMNEQSLDMYKDVPGVVRLDTEFGATMLIPTQHLEEEIIRVVTNQASTQRLSLIVTTNCNPIYNPWPHPTYLPPTFYLPTFHPRSWQITANPTSCFASPVRSPTSRSPLSSGSVRAPHLSKGRTPVWCARVMR